MCNDDKVNQSRTEAEEQRLGESLRKAFSSCNPNPDRKGCPDPKLIRDLAFHKGMDDPKLFEQLTLHISECSECAREARYFAEQYNKQEAK
jgi:hypothetical protein